MSERDYLLAALVEEVLGPRGGRLETLAANQDPRSEYVSGVLAPRESREQPDIDAEGDLPEGDEDDEQGDTGAEAAPVTFSPTLNPKGLPHSIGLSFVVRDTENEPASIEACATWARYEHPPQAGVWQRTPDHFLTGVFRADADRVWLEARPGVSLYFRSRRQSDPHEFRVSLYLVNTTAPRDSEHIDTPELLFQPQIRVNVAGSTVALPLHSDDHPQDGDPEQLREDASLSLLYRGRRPLARGHLCGASWRAIDPERPHPGGQALPPSSPYRWTDAESVPQADRTRFSPPDLRTDLTPSYPVEAPEADWRDIEFPSRPQLDPSRLAEMWNPADVRAALDPLVEGYAEWIRARSLEVNSLAPAQQLVADRHLRACRRAEMRIRRGIELLGQDPEVRLAFCFANQAIALQSGWARNGVVINWRPFQLAFILLNIAAIVRPGRPERRICDLLWFPTGGGKTEAYLGLAAFTLAYRRRRSPLDAAGQRSGGAGLSVISRYTLRLLTIQQFRRALGVITACEFLRVRGLATGTPAGWRPQRCSLNEEFLWGTGRFSAGLWVGGNVTPNGFHRIEYQVNGQWVREPGAFDLLDGAYRTLGVAPGGTGEPAQVLTCPCCRWQDGGERRLTNLAIPEEEGLGRGRHRLHLVLTADPPVPTLSVSRLNSSGQIAVVAATATPTAAPRAWTLTLDFDVLADRVTAAQIDDWWNRVVEPALRGMGWANLELCSTRASRPGYFFREYTTGQNTTQRCDFDIFCPNPECELNTGRWAEQVPVRVSAAAVPAGGGGEWQDVPVPFRVGGSSAHSGRTPIPALTVDDQIYHRCPSLLVATADKFARLAHEAKAGSLFGVVDRYHARWGYYRAGSPPAWGGLPQQSRDDPPGRGSSPLHVPVPRFEPADLVLQDELHLIEGPLGSMVGLYEAAVDLLSERRIDGVRVGPKYVASTATVRQASTQIQALFDRELAQFPPPGLTADDSFFSFTRETHPLDAARAGRLYVGICAPGKGAQTPIVRIWSALLQAADMRRTGGAPLNEIDGFWTLVGYFNAIRELAGARALYRQDIPDWMQHRAGGPGAARPLPSDDDRPIELSSRTSSVRLPSLLERLAVCLPRPDAEVAVQATSMFGTGVDVDRLGLMVVHGQPKTTAAYIQATGRVGRRGGGLVVSFLRATRPRDLDHFEFFTGYHRALYGFVEPITVAPFSPRARERGLGPILVAILRQAAHIDGHVVPADLRIQQRLAAAGAFRSHASHIDAHWGEPAIQRLPDLLEARAIAQPGGRQPEPGRTRTEAESALDVWRQLARRFPGDTTLVYYEPTLVRAPTHPVVLGDPHHQQAGIRQAYRNAPQSLREVEATTRFQG